MDVDFLTSNPFGCVPPPKIGRPQSLDDVVANLERNDRAQKFAKDHGLNITKISWDDNSRYKGSSFGDVITDSTMVVNGRCMPLVRNPNYTDLTCDIPISNFNLTIGNETKDGELKRISFEQMLKTELTKQTKGKIKNMYLDRDMKILVRAQASFIPGAKDSKTSFNQRLRCYGTQRDNPSILAIVGSSNGTSVQVITEDNQDLFFNKAGRAANFEATRLTRHRELTNTVKDTKEMDEKEKEQNVLFIFQIPLKQKKIERRHSGFDFGMLGSTPKSKSLYSFPVAYPQMGGAFAMESASAGSFMASCAAIPASFSFTPQDRSLGLEDAIVSVGEGHSDFKGTQDMTLERDERYPITLTIQFFKMLDTADIPEIEFINIADKIKRIHELAGVSGSLVTDGFTGRITESQSSKIQPPYIPKTLSDKERQEKPSFSFL
jgi:hypothetical protein